MYRRKGGESVIAVLGEAYIYYHKIKDLTTSEKI